MTVNRRGFTLLEIVLACACIGLIAIPIAGVMINWVKGEQSPQVRINAQQAASELIQQLNRDFRAASEISDPSEKSVTLKVGSVYVRYNLKGGLIRQEGPSASGPFTDKASYSVTGGTFLFYDTASQPATDSSKISSILLSGLKVQGGDYSISLPAITVSQRYVVHRALSALPFGYVIFSGKSGGTLFFPAKNTTINGKVHSNGVLLFEDDKDAENTTATVWSATNRIGGYLKGVFGEMLWPARLVAFPQGFPSATETVEITPGVYENGYSGHGNIVFRCAPEQSGNFNGGAIQGDIVTYDGNIDLSGIKNLKIQGRLYAPNGNVRIKDCQNVQVNQVIGQTVEIGGNQLTFGPLK